MLYADKISPFGTAFFVKYRILQQCFQVLQAIQVSYDISAEKTRKREINGLLLAAMQTKYGWIIGKGRQA